MHVARIHSRRLLAAAALVWVALQGPSAVRAAVLLDDSFADGDRTSASPPNSSPVYIGQSAGNGSNAVTTGALQFVLPTNSLKTWTYFTSDQSAPDGNQPHNAVTQLGVGDRLVASMTFVLPNGATSTNTGKDFRLGVFFDPTDARVQADVNSDGGGGTAPWTDATGYAVQLPLNATSSGGNPLQVGKRTTSNSSLLGSSGAYTFAPTGGNAYALSEDTSYTVQLLLHKVSAGQLDVTASLSQGATVLSTLTVSDTGTAFGGTVVGAGLLQGGQGVYSNFDQIFFRMSSNAEATDLNVTNSRAEFIPVPEPTVLEAAVLGGAGFVLRRRRV